MSAAVIRSSRLLAGGWLCAWLFGGCATAWQTEELRKTPPAGLASTRELTQVPFYPQQQYQCGPAALATVLNHYTLAISPQELQPQVYLPAREGSLQVEMSATARRYGMLVYPLQPELVDLLAEVAAGRPVLVLQNLGFAWLPQWHYAVVVGYDLPSAELVLRSGTTRRWQTSLAAFERTWGRADYWAQVILPAGQIPHTAEPLRYLRSVLDLEQTGQTDAAYLAYEAAARRWPRQPQVWLTLGNVAYQRQDYSQAVAAFVNATRIQPENATGWNNLAYALLQRGCPRQARYSIACAVSHAPNEEFIQESQAEIERLASGQDQSGCPVIQCPGL
jgi:tetratricopeptide (TPR) repeat protein